MEEEAGGTLLMIANGKPCPSTTPASITPHVSRFVTPADSRNDMVHPVCQLFSPIADVAKVTKCVPVLEHLSGIIVDDVIAESYKGGTTNNPAYSKELVRCLVDALPSFIDEATIDGNLGFARELSQCMVNILLRPYPGTDNKRLIDFHPGNCKFEMEEPDTLAAGVGQKSASSSKRGQEEESGQQREQEAETNSPW